MIDQSFYRRRGKREPLLQGHDLGPTLFEWVGLEFRDGEKMSGVALQVGFSASFELV